MDNALPHLEMDQGGYCQQVAIDQAALEVQKRQLASSEQTLEANRKTVISDEADVREKTSDNERAQKLWKVGTTSTQLRDQAETVLPQSTAALARDQAMVRAAESNAELAKADIQNAAALAAVLLGARVAFFRKSLD